MSIKDKLLRHDIPHGTPTIRRDDLDRMAQRAAQEAQEHDEDYPDLDLDTEYDDPAPAPRHPDAIDAIAGAALHAAIPPATRRKFIHAKAIAVVVTVPTQAWVAPLSTHFRKTFGSRWHIYERPEVGPAGSLQTPDGSASAALSRGLCVAGLAADVGRLPTTLRSAADMTIEIPAPTGDVLRTAIARFCRRSCAELPEGIAASPDLHDIAAAFRPGTGPQRISQPGLDKSTFGKMVSRAISAPIVFSSVQDWLVDGERSGLHSVLACMNAAFDRAAASDR